eukprot:SAG11_NODE_29563_length_309_cov_1.228571_1_plen_25_part_01
MHMHAGLRSIADFFLYDFPAFPSLR